MYSRKDFQRHNDYHDDNCLQSHLPEGPGDTNFIKTNRRDTNLACHAEHSTNSEPVHLFPQLALILR